MEKNNRDQERSGVSTQTQSGQSSSTQNTSGQGAQQDQNPQEGNAWSNYRTREMGDSGTENREESRS